MFCHILPFIRFLPLKMAKYDQTRYIFVINSLSEFEWAVRDKYPKYWIFGRIHHVLFTKWCWLDGTLELSGNINFQSTCKRVTNYQLFLGSINKRFEVKSCNCEKPSRFSSFPFCPLDDAISFVELSVDIFKLSVYYTHLNNIYGVLKMYIYPKFGIHKNSKYRNISSESYDSPDLRQSVVKT